MLQLHRAAGLENDEYVRQIDGYLPTCEVAFIDEIFKANSAILNALLTLLNERLFDNGNQRLRVPLLCMVSRVIHGAFVSCPSLHALLLPCSRPTPDSIVRISMDGLCTSCLHMSEGGACAGGSIE